METLRIQFQSQSTEITKLQSEKQELLQKLVMFQDFPFLPLWLSGMTHNSCFWLFMIHNCYLWHKYFHCQAKFVPLVSISHCCFYSIAVPNSPNIVWKSSWPRCLSGFLCFVEDYSIVSWYGKDSSQLDGSVAQCCRRHFDMLSDVENKACHSLLLPC